MTLRMILAIATASGLAAPAFADDLSFTLSNLTATELTEFYASPVGNDNWEENILAGNGLAAGGSGEVVIAGAQGCAYDLRMVFADGDVLQDNTDICATGTYTIQ
ncbi:hypothetical protein [Gemmobacter serpentinus]|uniref:hypothetical protein n=1 Tax=Gemmobacter serpentinus TaxID=2652247 RepID=UPI00124D7127|nr:hypothetical protein [Gemmobacter serpentinus]